MKRVGDAERSSRFDHAENTNDELFSKRRRETRADEGVSAAREEEPNNAPTDPEATGIG